MFLHFIRVHRKSGLEMILSFRIGLSEVHELMNKSEY